MILLLLLSLQAQAGTWAITKQVEPSTLRQELEASAFQVQSLNCVNSECYLVMPDSELKDPQPVIDAHVYVDPKARVAQRRQQLITLARKLKNQPQNMTAADRDNMLLLISYLLVAVD